MAESILNGKKLLIVDDEPDILEVLDEEIHEACANCSVDKATSYEGAVQLLESNHYDLTILDIMGVRGFDLLESAVLRNLRVVMLTAHALSPETLKKSHDLGAMAYLPKDKLGEIVHFLEDALEHEHGPNWRRLLDKLENYFEERFKPNWKEKSGIS